MRNEEKRLSTWVHYLTGDKKKDANREYSKTWMNNFTRPIKFDPTKINRTMIPKGGQERSEESV